MQRGFQILSEGWGNATLQAQKLMRSYEVAFNNLNERETLVSTIEDTGNKCLENFRRRNATGKSIHEPVQIN
jgi:hypothetical protein